MFEPYRWGGRKRSETQPLRPCARISALAAVVLEVYDNGRRSRPLKLLWGWQVVPYWFGDCIWRRNSWAVTKHSRILVHCRHLTSLESVCFSPDSPFPFCLVTLLLPGRWWYLKSEVSADPTDALGPVHRPQMDAWFPLTFCRHLFPERCFQSVSSLWSGSSVAALRYWGLRFPVGRGL